MERESGKGKGGKKGRKGLAQLFGVLSMAVLAALVLVCAPLTVPRIFGYQIYSVISGSMEPEIPVHSVIYVEEAAPEEIAAGDIIAFQSGDSIITHRVVENHVVEGTFTTKGDANAQKDMEDVRYGQLSGRVARHYPLIGGVMTLYTSKIGKAYVICFAACGAMFNILAGRIRARRKEV